MKNIGPAILTFLVLFIVFSGCVTQDIHQLINQNPDVNSFLSANPDSKVNSNFYTVSQSNELIQQFKDYCPDLTPNEYIVVNFSLTDKNQDKVIILSNQTYATVCIILLEQKFNEDCNSFIENIKSKTEELEKTYKEYSGLSCVLDINKEISLDEISDYNNCNNFKLEITLLDKKIQEIKNKIITCYADKVSCNNFETELTSIYLAYSNQQDKNQQLTIQISQLEKELKSCPKLIPTKADIIIIPVIKQKNSFCPDLVNTLFDKNTALQEITGEIESKNSYITLLNNSIAECKSSSHGGGGGGGSSSGNTSDDANEDTEPEDTQTDFQNLVLANEEAEWILTAQKPSGALALTPDSPHIMPYFANMALTSVIELGDVYGDAVKNYMDWYFEHLNRVPDDIGVVGTIYDYYSLPDGTEVTEKSLDPEKKNYDSSDSYAATFLSLANAYYNTTGDDGYITGHVDDLKLIAGAIDATLQPIGLTYAKADYHALYLMDNVEVWRGYQDFSELLDSLGDSEANSYFEKAEIVREAIEENLWDEEKQEYTPYYGHTMKWNVFYADASANLWPIIFDLPEAQGDRKSIIWDKFLTAQPGWLDLTADGFPWVSIALGALKNNDSSVLETYLENISNEFFSERSYPWYISESGWYIRILS